MKKSVCRVNPNCPFSTCTTFTVSSDFRLHNINLNTFQEEKEKRLEEMFEADLDNSLENRYLPQQELPEEGAVAVAGKKTQETLSATDSIIEALDIAAEELKRMAEHEVYILLYITFLCLEYIIFYIIYLDLLHIAGGNEKGKGCRVSVQYYYAGPLPI